MLKDELRRADLLLFLLYVAYCGTVIVRVQAEGTHYLSPDSEFYLEVAQNLREGNGFYMSNTYPIPEVKTPENQVFFSMWPVGYPLLIFFTSLVTTLDVFWASKILNLLLLGLGFLTLRYLNRQHSYVLASVYCGYTFVEVYSYTWSEAGFLLGALWLAIILHRMFKEPTSTEYLGLLCLVCLYLFLVRYIGLFTFALPAAGFIYHWIKRERGVSLKYLVAFVALCAVAALYFSMNYYYTGTTTGGDRSLGDAEELGQLVLMFFKAVFNELLVIRRYSFRATPDLLFVATTSLQILVLLFVLREIKGTKGISREFKDNTFSHTCLVVGGLYLLLVTALRSVSPFDALNYRILSPFTLLLYIGLVNYVIVAFEHHRNFQLVKLSIFVFFLISLALNLPKKYIIDLVLG